MRLDGLLLLVLHALLCGLIGCSAYSQEHGNITDATADSTQTFESFYYSLPDSVKSVIESKSLYDNFKDCFDDHKDKLSQMPIFKPDSSLTASMPVIKPPPVDEDMIFPVDWSCSKFLLKK